MLIGQAGRLWESESATGRKDDPHCVIETDLVPDRDIQGSHGIARANQATHDFSVVSDLCGGSPSFPRLTRFSDEPALRDTDAR